MSSLMKRYGAVLSAVVFLAGAVFLSMKTEGKTGTLQTESRPPASAGIFGENSSAPAAPGDEMRAVWVPYMSLAMNGEKDQSETAFHKKFDAIVSGAKEKGLNTLIVHVRPFGDALYPSQYFPWSHILTGTQGVNPGYDPLEYMVKAAHAAGLKIHAWVNPLRIQTSGTPSILAQSNPYSRWKEEGVKGYFPLVRRACLNQCFSPQFSSNVKEKLDADSYITGITGSDTLNFDVRWAFVSTSK